MLIMHKLQPFRNVTFIKGLRHSIRVKSVLYQNLVQAGTESKPHIQITV